MSTRTPERSPGGPRGPNKLSPRESERKLVASVDVVFQTDGQAPRFGTLSDLSIAGSKVETSKPHAEGEVVLLYLPWPSRDEPTGFTSVVRWANHGSMGVQFTMVGAAQLDAIANLTRGVGARTDRPKRKEEGQPNPFSRDELLAVPEPIFSQERRVRFQEVDAAGTIYYSRIFEYFGDAYIERLERAGFSVPKAMTQRDWLAPLVHAEADYVAPMRFGDIVNVSIVRVRCGSSAVTVGYRISDREGHVLALGHTVHVFVDSATFRPRPVPDDIRLALTAPHTEPGA